MAERPAEAIVVAKLDRLSRSVFDFADLVRLSDERDFALVVLEPDLDFSTPSGRLFSTILSGFAEFERDMIRTRTREALAAKKARGERLGRPVEIAVECEAKIVELWRAGKSTRFIAGYLNAGTTQPSWRPARGQRWYPSTVQVVIQRARRADLLAGEIVTLRVDGQPVEVDPAYLPS